MKYIKQFFLFILTSFIAYNLQAQVPVREEPHHKPVLENNYVRLLDVHLNAGDTTQYHIHATPSVIVFISNSFMGAQLTGKAPAAPNEVFPAQTLFVDYGTNPITHRVYNTGNNVFHVMDIELLKPAPAQDSCAALSQSNLQPASNEKLANVYKLNLDKDGSLSLPAGNCAYLAICISGEIVSANKKIKEGEYIFFDPGNTIKLTNQQEKKATCVLLQLK